MYPAVAFTRSAGGTTASGTARDFLSGYRTVLFAPDHVGRLDGSRNVAFVEVSDECGLDEVQLGAEGCDWFVGGRLESVAPRLPSIFLV